MNVIKKKTTKIDTKSVIQSLFRKMQIIKKKKFLYTLFPKKITQKYLIQELI